MKTIYLHINGVFSGEIKRYNYKSERKSRLISFYKFLIKNHSIQYVEAQLHSLGFSTSEIMKINK